MNSHGAFSMIVPDALLARDEAAQVRDLLLKNGLRRVYHCGPVFPAAVSAVVLVVDRSYKADRVAVDGRHGIGFEVRHPCSITRFRRDPARRLLVHTSDGEAAVLDRLTALPQRLQDYLIISRGEEIGKKDVSKEGQIPIVVGEDIRRYYIRLPTRFIVTIKKNPDLYRAPKILVVKTGQQPVAALDYVGHVTIQSVYNLSPAIAEVPLEVLLAILNSKLIAFMVKRTFTAYKRIFPQLNQATLASLPLPALPPQGVQATERVREMLDLQKRLANAKTTHEKTLLQRQIASTDHQIDQLVYELYGLTEEEIKIVEEGERGDPESA